MILCTKKYPNKSNMSSTVGVAASQRPWEARIFTVVGEAIQCLGMECLRIGFYSFLQMTENRFGAPSPFHATHRGTHSEVSPHSESKSGGGQCGSRWPGDRICIDSQSHCSKGFSLDIK